MKITIDEETCIGCGLCTDTCPEVIEMVDDKARTKSGEVPKEAAEKCREAADSCPVEAIKAE